MWEEGGEWSCVREEGWRGEVCVGGGWGVELCERGRVERGGVCGMTGWGEGEIRFFVSIHYIL